ncbi:hypothetical protein PG985_005046 [Apiospora marii]|uniref:uncharacterized protein n=1 Tax=Apiospora marii TaxID=335849 RepID=UPI00312D7CBB
MHISLLHFFLLPAAVVSGAAVPVASRQQPLLAARDGVPSSLPHITSVQYSGDGCPSSAPAVDKSGDGFDDVSFRLNAFAVSGADVYSSTANCEVHVQASGASAGWQVGVSDVYVRGRLRLDPGAQMDFYVTTFWSQGAANTGLWYSPPPSYPLTYEPETQKANPSISPLPPYQVTVRGNLKNTGGSRSDQIATAHGSIPGDRIAWGPCTGSSGDIGILNVNFRTALQGDGNFGGKGGDSAVESWDYVWRRC